MPTGRVYQREASPHSSARDELHLCVRAGVPETAVGAHSAKAPSAEPGARQLTPIAEWRAAQSGDGPSKAFSAAQGNISNPTFFPQELVPVL